MQLFKKSNEWTFIHKSIFDTKVEATSLTTYRELFTTKNLAKAKQLRMWNVWVANEYVYRYGKKVKNNSWMPDTIKHYIEHGDWIQVPIGISSYYPSKFSTEYYDCPIVFWPLTRTLYPHQEDTINKALQRPCWLIHASTWAGKTTIICEIARRLKRKTLIVVQNLTQMKQMVDDITMIMWFVPKQVSWKAYSKKALAEMDDRVTVCSIESRDKLNMQDYWCILLDECDTYLASDERRKWLLSLSPEYMYALTGTVQVNDMEDSVFKLYYWFKTELIIKHMIPDYMKVRTDFISEAQEFYELEEDLYTAEERNKLIVDIVDKHARGRKWIVFCKRVEHARVLAEMIRKKGFETYLLIWEVGDAEREEIRQKAKESKNDVILVGSVKILGRGFDLPELSFWLLTTAERFTSNIEQYIGRIIRAHPTKPHPVFIDMCDENVWLLLNQSKSRERTYKREFNPSYKPKYLNNGY